MEINFETESNLLIKRASRCGCVTNILIVLIMLVCMTLFKKEFSGEPFSVDMTRTLISSDDNQPNTTSHSNMKMYDLRKIKSYDHLSLHSYSGKWRSNQSIFDFANLSGDITLSIQRYLSREQNNLYYGFIIMISDGVVSSNWVVIKNYHLIPLMNDTVQFDIVMNETETTQNHPHNFTAHTQFSSFTELRKFNNFNLNYNMVLRMNLSAYYMSNVSGDNVDSNNRLYGNLLSTVFDVDFEIEAQKHSIFTKISKFSIGLSFIGLLQIFNFKHLMEKFIDNESSALKYSSTVFLINSIRNVFISYNCFYISIYDEKLFNDFIVPHVIYFCMFPCFEIKIIGAIWRAEIFRSVGEDFTVKMRRLRNKLIRFYLCYYSINLIIFLYIIHIYYWNTFIIISSLGLLPQIIKNFQTGRKRRIETTTIIIISINVLYVHLYLFLCPNNFMNTPTNSTLSCILIVLVSAQLVILLLQAVFGMRCLIPRSLRQTNKYNYFKTLPQLKKMSIDIDSSPCSICLGYFNPTNEGNTSRLNSLKVDIEAGVEAIPPHNRGSCLIRNIKKVNEAKTKLKEAFNGLVNKCDNEEIETPYMYTQCGHLFHTTCLKGWLNVKNTCPQCRRNLNEIS